MTKLTKAKNWRSGTKLKFWVGSTQGGDVWRYVCPACFREVDENDNYCNMCGFYLKGKCVSNFKEARERLKDL